LRLLTWNDSGGSGRAPSASTITRMTSTSWWNGSSSRPTTSMSAWVNWR
jgi:hypothetical protein